MSGVEPAMTRRLTRTLIGAGLLLSVAACGDSDTSGASTIAPVPSIALEYSEVGGCQMMGPNCATYVVYDSGKVEVFRTGEDAPAELTGEIPAAEVAAWLQSLEAVDFDALAAEVGPGECQSCVDGVDITATIHGAGGPVVLDSTKVRFDPANGVFAGLERLMTDVRAVGQLSLRQRG